MNATPCLRSRARRISLLHAEPEFDFANPAAARAALEQAELVVVAERRSSMATAYADVLLPIAPFTETAGTFVNCEGRVQASTASCSRSARRVPGWKVLRVLGTLLGLAGIRCGRRSRTCARRCPAIADIADRLGNATSVTPRPRRRPPPPAALERIAEVPIYFADPLVRRSPPLQHTADARAPTARMHRSLFATLGVARGRASPGEAGPRARRSSRRPSTRRCRPASCASPAAHPSTCGLEGLSGPVSLERV